jgi:hypothetical protein
VAGVPGIAVFVLQWLEFARRAFRQRDGLLAPLRDQPQEIASKDELFVRGRQTQ